MVTDRVFLDTNVLVSGLVFDGNESRLLELATIGRIRLVISDTVLQEARRVLADKFASSAGVLDRFLGIVEYESVHVPADDMVDRADGMLRDPNDALILAAIMISRPDFAVTGDKDLLTAEIRTAYPVMTSVECLARLFPG